MPEPHRVIWPCAHAPSPLDPRVCAKCARRPLAFRENITRAERAAQLLTCPNGHGALLWDVLRDLYRCANDCGHRLRGYELHCRLELGDAAFEARYRRMAWLDAQGGLPAAARP